MRIPRMTTRRWMVAVFVIALLLYGAAMWRRSVRFRALGDEYADWLNVEMLPSSADMNDVARAKAINAAAHEWNRAMALKCRRAARYPWLPVEPDPPEPKWE